MAAVTHPLATRSSLPGPLVEFGARHRGARRPVPGGRPARLVRPVRPDAATYRRRRLAALGLLLVLGALLLAAGQLLAARLAGGAGTGGDLVPVGRVSVVVEPGDTVWSLAAEVAPSDRDLRPVVDAIVQANGGATLVPGQRLELAVP